MLQSFSLLILIIPYIALRLVFWLKAFPNPDEAYYWLWGQQLDWSYYDQPPLLAWVQALFAKMFGQSLWSLRLPNLFSNLTFFYTYFLLVNYLYPQITKSQRWKYFGEITLATFSSPLYFVMLSLAWHDHLMISLSLVSAYITMGYGFKGF
jgi:4-amino-4-deoxy-L-arabinose transferase-like glycosyltransferase